MTGSSGLPVMLVSSPDNRAHLSRALPLSWVDSTPVPPGLFDKEMVIRRLVTYVLWSVLSGLALLDYCFYRISVIGRNYALLWISFMLAL